MRYKLPERTIATVLTVIAVVMAFGPFAALAEGQVTISLKWKANELEGTPLHWNAAQVTLMARDGYLWQFPPQEAEDFVQTSPQFRPFSYAEMRGSLQEEFGRGFEVSGTGHYIVVHPAGQRDVWPHRFEELYRSFRHFFTQRGFQLEEPQFPLVAVVFGSRVDFDRYAQRSGGGKSSQVLGYYSPTSNRVMLYDLNDGQPASEFGTTQNEATIIHEATHQTAFNTGIHSRLGSTPRWVGEGLGTLFEAPGVYNSRVHLELEDRINAGRLRGYREYANRRRAGSLAEMIAADRPFFSDPQGAYAEAWATIFYLSEREPARLAQYIARIRLRPDFEIYTPQQRLEDFQSVFGADLRMMETRVERFVAELPATGS